MLKPLEYVYIDVVIGLYWNLNKWNRNIQTPILHSTMQLIIKITQSGFSPVILAVDTWSIHVWQTEATRARCYLRREREGVKTQHNWHNSLACQRSPVYSAALSAVLTFLLAAFQPTTPVFPSTLALNMEDAYTVLCDIRARNKVFRRACSQVILLNHQIEAAKACYDCARAVKRLSFRYSNRLKLTSLEGVRNLVYEFACVKCEEIEGLQAKLRELTGGVYDFEESDESDSDDQLSDC